MRRGFPLYERFDYCIKKLRESGMFFKWRYDSIVNLKKVLYPENDGKMTKALRLDHVYLSFVLFVINLAVATVIFIIECHLS